jgi:hypothetical protein
VDNCVGFLSELLFWKFHTVLPLELDVSYVIFHTNLFTEKKNFSTYMFGYFGLLNISQLL